MFVKKDLSNLHSITFDLQLGGTVVHTEKFQNFRVLRT